MDTGAKERRASARGRTPGQDFLVPLWRLTKGTRRKGETISRRYRSNGYVHSQQNTGRLLGRLRGQASSTVDRVQPRERGWLSGRLRWQASSTVDRVQPRERGVGCQAAFAGKPAPTVGRVQARERGWLWGRHRWQASSYRRRRRRSDRVKQLVMRPVIAATDNTITPRGLGLVQRLVSVVEPQGRVSVAYVEGCQADARG